MVRQQTATLRAPVRPRQAPPLIKGYGDVAESADASDLKSGGGNTVWVQVPSSPPLKNLKIARNSDFFVFVLFFRTNYRTFVHSLHFLVMILSSKISSDGAPYTSE